MKTTINGIEVEGTPDEILELINKTKKDIFIQPTAPIFKRKKSSIRAEKFEQAAEFVKKGYTRTSALRKVNLNPSKSIGGSEVRKLTELLELKGYKYSERIGKTTKFSYKKFKEKTTIPKKDDKRVARFRFMSTRAWYLMKHFNYKREKAFSMAADEWRTQKKKATKHSHTCCNMPKILENKDNNKLLFDVLGCMINNNAKMTFNNEGAMFGFCDYFMWGNFLVSIITKNDEICEYFNVENKFKIMSEGGRKTLVYGGQ